MRSITTKVIRAGIALAIFGAAACDNGDSAAPPAVTSPSATQAIPPPAATVPAPTLATSAGPGATPTSALEPSGPAWSTRAPLLIANSEIAVAQLDGRVYVIGGYPSSRVVSSVVQVYTAATNSWQLAPPLPVSLHHTMAAGVNGKLYVIGGETAGSGSTSGTVPPAGAGFVASVYEFDPASNTWRTRSPMPTARSGGAVAVIDELIYVAGGRPPRGADFAVYDPAQDRWTTLPNLPSQRNHLAVAAMGGKVYVAGGRFGGGVGSEMTDVLEVYDPVLRTWESRAPMSSPRAGINGVAANGCFYVFGGEGNDADPRGVFDDVEVHDPRSNSWSPLPAIPAPVHGVTGAAFIDGWIHLAGGGTTRGGSSGSTLHQVLRASVSCG